MNKWSKLLDKQNIGLSILVSFSFSLLMFLFAPLDNYIANAKDLWFSLSSIMPPYLIMFALSFLVCVLVLSVVKGTARKVLISLAFSATLAFYIQGNFLTRGYGIMDGDEINWASMTGKGILDTVFWVLCFALPLVLLFIKEKIFLQVVKLGSIIISGILIVTLSISILTPNSDIKVKNSYLSDENLFTISQKENIITVVADTFESSYLTKILEESPEYKQKLNDFIFFKNTTGVSTYTYLSMATLLTGNIFPLDASYSSGMKQVFDQSNFFDSMHRSGYDVNYYTEGQFLRSTDCGKVSNLIPEDIEPNINATTAIIKRFYRFTLFKFMPHFMKKYFVVNTDDFNSFQKIGNRSVYVFDDINFNHRLQANGFALSKSKKQYTLYHLLGVHAPYTTDRNFNPVSYDKSVPIEKRALEKAYVPLKIFINLVDDLKKKGVYDNTTIIFVADHGYNNRFNNVFMVKPAHYAADFKVSLAPVSLLEDYIPFIEQTASGKGMDADLFKIPEDKQRTRYVYSYYSDGGYGGKNTSRMKIAVNGNSWDLSSYEVLETDYTAKNTEISGIALGQKVGIKDQKNIRVQGIQLDNCMTYSKNASMEVKLKELPKSLTMQLDCSEVMHHDQTLIVKIGAKEIYNKVVPIGTSQILVPIPSDCITNDLKIDFTFPDCEPYADKVSETLHWWAYSAFVFPSVTFK